MFDKKLYWERRNSNPPLRGQIGHVDKIIPKGTVDLYKKKGVVKRLANDIGSHMVRTKGKGITYLNRRDFRHKQVLRSFTTSNYKYQIKKLGVVHDVSEPNKDLKLPVYPSKINNHTRHRQHQIARQLKTDKKKETADVSQ